MQTTLEELEKQHLQEIQTAKHIEESKAKSFLVADLEKAGLTMAHKLTIGGLSISVIGLASGLIFGLAHLIQTDKAHKDQAQEIKEEVKKEVKKEIQK